MPDEQDLGVRKGISDKPKGIRIVDLPDFNNKFWI